MPLYIPRFASSGCLLRQDFRPVSISTCANAQSSSAVEYKPLFPGTLTVSLARHVQKAEYMS
jgi:hypothetical protein